MKNIWIGLGFAIVVILIGMTVRMRTHCVHGTFSGDTTLCWVEPKPPTP